MATITSANAVFMLSVAGLYPVGQKLQGFSMDDMFSVGEVKPAEIQLGVDGFLTAGWIPTVNEMTIMLLASSPSISLFETWDNSETASRSKLIASGTISLTSTGTTYTLTNGYLTTTSRMPDAGKVLKPRHWGITWQSILPSPQ